MKRILLGLVLIGLAWPQTGVVTVSQLATDAELLAASNALRQSLTNGGVGFASNSGIASYSTNSKFASNLAGNPVIDISGLTNSGVTKFDAILYSVAITNDGPLFVEGASRFNTGLSADQITLTGPLIVNSNDILGLQNPTVPSQAVNKAYVDNATNGIGGGMWTNWSPGVGSRGGVAISGSNVILARYVRTGNTLQATIAIFNVVSTTTNQKLVFTLPFRISSNMIVPGQGITIGNGFENSAVPGTLQVTVGDVAGEPTDKYNQAFFIIDGGNTSYDATATPTTHNSANFLYEIEQGY